MAERQPWDKRPVRAADRRKLAAARVDMDDPRVQAYLKNRNDFAGDGVEGRRVVDASLRKVATGVHDDADGLAATVRHAAHRAERSVNEYDDHEVDRREAAAALREAAEALADMQYRLETLADALTVRADDDDASAALRRFVDALRNRPATEA